MPTKIKSGATGNSPHKTTTFELLVNKKKLRKMVLPFVDDEEVEDE